MCVAAERYPEFPRIDILASAVLRLPAMRPEVEQAALLLRENTPESVAAAIALLQRTVFAFSMKVCGHPEDAEDTMQEVLMRAAPHLARLPDAQALAVWLYTVTRRRCWRMRRKPAGAPTHTLSLDDLMPGEAELSALASRSAPTAEDAAITAQQQQLIHRAVLTIPPEYRIALVLHDMEDLDTEQIARVLDLKPGTVRVRLHRARLAVRKEIAARLDSEPTVAAAQPPAAQTSRRASNARRKNLPAARRQPADCSAIFANLSELLDERLPAADCARMERHIEACPNCVVFLRDLRQAIERCRGLETGCDSQVGEALRGQLTREYLRLMRAPAA